MSLISDVLSNQIFAHAFSSIRPGLVKASDPREKIFLAPPTSKGKCTETKQQYSTQDGHWP